MAGLMVAVDRTVVPGGVTNKMQSWEASKIADQVVQIIKPMAHDVVVVGSLRRGMKEVKDIDILVRPMVCEQTIQPAMFFKEQRTFNIVNQTLIELTKHNSIRVVGGGDKKTEITLNGEKPIKIELYFVFDILQWGGAMLVRTGPKEVSKRIMGFALHKHWHFKDYILHQHEKSSKGKGGECKKHIECPLIIKTPKEIDVFDALGMAYPNTGARHVENIIRLEKDALGLGEDVPWH